MYVEVVKCHNKGLSKLKSFTEYLGIIHSLAMKSTTSFVGHQIKDSDEPHHVQ